MYWHAHILTNVIQYTFDAITMSQLLTDRIITSMEKRQINCLFSDSANMNTHYTHTIDLGRASVVC